MPDQAWDIYLDVDGFVVELDGVPVGVYRTWAKAIEVRDAMRAAARAEEHLEPEFAAAKPQAQAA